MTESLRLVGLDEFVVRPSTSWLVRNLIPAQSLVLVFGAPKGGKTFSVCDLLMAAAHGLDWHGCAIPKPLRVAFLVGEGASWLRVRLRAWLDHRDTSELRGDFKLLPEPFDLAERATEVVELLAAYRADVVMVDTVNAFFGRLDENSTADMSKFVGALRRIRDSVGCSVVALHHTGVADAGRERGSGVLRGAADVVVQVGRDDSGSDNVGFQVVAARDFESWSQPIALRLRRVETEWRDDDGQPMASCVVEPASSPVTLAGRARKLSDSQRAVVEAVQELTRQHANGSDEVLLPRLEVVQRAVERGSSRAAAYRALEHLGQRFGWHLAEPASVIVDARRS